MGPGPPARPPAAGDTAVLGVRTSIDPPPPSQRTAIIVVGVLFAAVVAFILGALLAAG